MIASFADRATEDLYHGRPTSRARRFPADIVAAALMKLDLRSPPGNRLEALRGDMNGLHSIRVNDQWRLVFRWQGNDAQDVRLTDYH